MQSGGEVLNLPTHNFDTGDGSKDLKCPTEVSITDRREAGLSKAGLIGLIHRKHTDKAAFIGAQTVIDPRNTLMSRQPPRQYVLAAAIYFRGVAVQPLFEMHGPRQDRAKPDRLSITDTAANLDPPSMYPGILKAPPSARRQRNPWPAPGRSGGRRGKPRLLHGEILPEAHFQLEGMDVGMSLVSKLPKGK